MGVGWLTDNGIDICLSFTFREWMLADMSLYQITITGIHALGRRHKNPAIKSRVISLHEVTFTPHNVFAEKFVQLGAQQFFNNCLFFAFACGFNPEFNTVAGQDFIHFIRGEKKLLAIVGIDETKAATGRAYPALKVGRAQLDFLLQRL